MTQITHSGSDAPEHGQQPLAHRSDAGTPSWARYVNHGVPAQPQPAPSTTAPATITRRSRKRAVVGALVIALVLGTGAALGFSGLSNTHVTGSAQARASGQGAAAQPAPGSPEWTEAQRQSAEATINAGLHQTGQLELPPQRLDDSLDQILSRYNAIRAWACTKGQPGSTERLSATSTSAWAVLGNVSQTGALYQIWSDVTSNCRSLAWNLRATLPGDSPQIIRLAVNDTEGFVVFSYTTTIEFVRQTDGSGRWLIAAAQKTT